MESNRILCKKYSIPYSKTGKLIVATDESELKSLHELYNTGVENGVEGLRIIDENEVHKLEPDVNAKAALFSPNTGIIDSHSLMSHLYKTAESSGVIFSFNSEVTLLQKKNDEYMVGIKDQNYRSKCKNVKKTPYPFHVGHDPTLLATRNLALRERGLNP